MFLIYSLFEYLDLPLGWFQVSLVVTLWSEYATPTNFHVGKKKFTRHPIVWRAV